MGLSVILFLSTNHNESYNSVVKKIMNILFDSDNFGIKAMGPNVAKDSCKFCNGFYLHNNLIVRQDIDG